jgi:ABC-type transport system involved in cytochrome c biogenesis permease component
MISLSLLKKHLLSAPTGLGAAFVIMAIALWHFVLPAPPIYTASFMWMTIVCASLLSTQTLFHETINSGFLSIYVCHKPHPFGLVLYHWLTQTLSLGLAVLPITYLLYHTNAIPFTWLALLALTLLHATTIGALTSTLSLHSHGLLSLVMGLLLLVPNAIFYQLALLNPPQLWPFVVTLVILWLIALALTLGGAPFILKAYTEDDI